MDSPNIYSKPIFLQIQQILNLIVNLELEFQVIDSFQIEKQIKLLDLLGYCYNELKTKESTKKSIYYYTLAIEKSKTTSNIINQSYVLACYTRSLYISECVHSINDRGEIDLKTPLVQHFEKFDESLELIEDIYLSNKGNSSGSNGDDVIMILVSILSIYISCIFKTRNGTTLITSRDFYTKGKSLIEKQNQIILDNQNLFSMAQGQMEIEIGHNNYYNGYLESCFHTPTYNVNNYPNQFIFDPIHKEKCRSFAIVTINIYRKYYGTDHPMFAKALSLYAYTFDKESLTSGSTEGMISGKSSPNQHDYISLKLNYDSYSIIKSYYGINHFEIYFAILNILHHTNRLNMYSTELIKEMEIIKGISSGTINNSNMNQNIYKINKKYSSEDNECCIIL